MPKKTPNTKTTDKTNKTNNTNNNDNTTDNTTKKPARKPKPKILFEGEVYTEDKLRRKILQLYIFALDANEEEKNKLFDEITKYEAVQKALEEGHTKVGVMDTYSPNSAQSAQQSAQSAQAKKTTQTPKTKHKTLKKPVKKLPKTATFISLGCPKNQVDFERMVANLFDNGYELIFPDEVFDGNKKVTAIIINTCSFIKTARDETIAEIQSAIELKKQGKVKFIIITGCYAERYQEEILKEFAEVDFVVGLGSNEFLGEMLTSYIDKRQSDPKFSNIQGASFPPKENLPLYGERVLDTAPYAYLKIAEGCSNHCTYCAIPKIRGEYRSVPLRKITEEAQILADSGKTEIIVVAQDTTQYGLDLYGEQRLHKLLKSLCNIKKIKRIRLLYAYPERIYDELIDVIAKEKKIVKYLDMPIQHCNDNILKAMNRKSTKAELTALIEKLREKIPGIVLRTSLIAGFPGETKTQFNELAKFVKDMKFDRLGCFAYSKEEGTPASKLPKQVKEETKQERADYIQDLQERIMQRKNDSRVGETVEVLIDGFEGIEDTEFFWFPGGKNPIEEFLAESPDKTVEQVEEVIDNLNAVNALDDENFQKVYEIFNSENYNTDNMTFNQFKTLIELMCKKNNSPQKNAGTTNKKSPSYLYSGRSYGEAPEIDFVIAFFSLKELNIGDYVSVKILTEGHGRLVGIIEE